MLHLRFAKLHLKEPCKVTVTAQKSNNERDSFSSLGLQPYKWFDVATVTV